MLIELLMAAAMTAPPTGDAAALRAKDQALLDAIAPGDRALWNQTLTADAVYIDENGTVFDRKQYLDGLKPLPPQASGKLTIVEYHVSFQRGVALVWHRDDERETFHGIRLRAQYLMSETWVRGPGGDWKLAMVHAYVVAPDPPAITLPLSAASALVGRYRAASDLSLSIKRAGAALTISFNGGKPQPLLAETPDVLFQPGRPRTRFLVELGSDGKISALIERREGEDLIWRRLD